MKFFESRLELNLYLGLWAVYGLNLSLLLIYTPLYLPQMGLADLSSVSLLFGLPAVTSILGQMFFGWLALQKDRFRHLSYPGLLSFALVFALLSLGNNSMGFWIAVGFHGFLAASMIPASKACATLLQPHRKAEVVSRLFAAESMGMALGSLATGLLLQVLGAGESVYASIYATAATCNILLAFLYWQFFPRTVQGIHAYASKSMHWKSYGPVLSAPGMREIMLFCLVVATASSFCFAYYGRYLQEVLGGSEMQVGISMTLATFLGGLAFPLFGRWVENKGTYGVLLGSQVAYGLCFLALHSTNSSWIWVFLYALPIYPMLMVASNQFVANHTEDSQRSMGFGLMDMVFPFAAVIAPLLGSVLFRAFDLEMLSLFSLLLLLPGCFLLPSLKKHAKKGQGSETSESLKHRLATD